MEVKWSIPQAIQHGHERFSTNYVQNNIDGCCGIEVICDASVVARVIFWDACGQLFVETIGRDIPLAVMEAVVQEAKQRVKIRYPATPDLHWVAGRQRTQRGVFCFLIALLCFEPRRMLTVAIILLVLLAATVVVVACVTNDKARADDK
jgi:hypothetical protein